MESDAAHPWFREAVELLQPRSSDRVLMVTSSRASYADAIARSVARDGTVRVIEPDRQIAEAIAGLDLPQLEVLALTPGPMDRFGSHDGFLACPLAMPLWPLSTWAALAVGNLRPGGRFVIDLPGEAFADPIAKAWADIGGTAAQLQPLRGVSERELAASLRSRGLRQVEAAMATHLLPVESPSALARWVCDSIGDRKHLDDLALALTARMRTAGDAEILVRRTRVHGIR